ncbi:MULTISPECIES: nucleoside deaminase [Auritidibacter]|uniref:nucleoside deaminase n=1 Tax=Auritidibacter TaxID=1160973 RepID=UPI000D727812|nr:MULTISPECIES: nucleoside deaminase [Auritidibacter]PXA79509.1 nucleoside deaminase [Auritidibacter sp. NML120779]AXR74458.1 nucleoside deaminase [Auritidibacter sp. NML130574]NIH72721.1 tRNA(Arg) A34 adenosine deaminase TadA [Auritidibacter ignavus]RMX23361.1 nucleoside deaminase [Auritidibacter ignavus]WGH80977.1 nucleoside deaminase [Auritidibacter ignavus]
MSTIPPDVLIQAMNEAVVVGVEHVEAGGLPFVGVLVDNSGVISDFGVNRVRETRDPTAHAEIVAMREVLNSDDRDDLSGTTLVATGEPCGLCYRFAIDQGVDAIYVAVDRDAVAEWGFDYRTSYLSLGITDELRSTVFNSFPAERGNEPFARYFHTHRSTMDADQRSNAPLKGHPS